MSHDLDREEREATDLTKLPPPPAWRPRSAEPYDFEAEGDDPALDEMDVDAVDATMEMDAQTRGARVALDGSATRGATPPATLLGWLTWSTGPRETPRPGGTLRPGRHVWRSVAHLAPAAKRWAYDTSSHKDAWRLTELKPHYATKQSAYDQWEAAIRQDMAGRPNVLLGTSFTLAVVLILFSVITFFIGAFYLLFGVWTAILLGLSFWGRHVAPDRGAARGARVAVEENATPEEAETPRVPGRGEIQEALVFAGVIKQGEEIGCEPVREMLGNGWATTVTLPRTTNAADAIGHLTDVAAAFDTVDPLVTMVPGADSNRRVWLWVADRDPLTGMSPRSPLIEAKGTVNVWNGIPFGYTVAGKRVRVAAVGTHWIVIGASGSGKTRAFGLVPLGYALDPYTQSILMDPEGFGAWAPYRAVAKVIEGSEPERLREMAATLKWVVETEMPRRKRVVERILATEPKLLPNNELDAKITRNKRYGVPALLIGLEEAVTLYSCDLPFDPNDTSARPKTVGQVAEEATGEIHRRGRKYAISLAMTSQKATTDLLPATVTFGATTRFMLACSKPTQADSCIPDWRAKGMTPLKLKPAKPARPGSGNPGAGFLEGVGLIEPEEDWVLLRSDYADGNEISDRMAYAREIRLKVWPELLPDHAPDQGVSTPAPTPEAPTAAPDELPEHDPDRLVELAGAFEGERERASVRLIEALQAGYPHDAVYRGLNERGMNRWLIGFGAGLRTASVRDSKLGDRKGLRLSVVTKAIDECVDLGDATEELAMLGAASHPASHAETGPDQGCDGATQDSAEGATPQDQPDSAEGARSGGRASHRRTHLGEVSLPVIVTPPGGHLL